MKRIRNACIAIVLGVAIAFGMDATSKALKKPSAVTQSKPAVQATIIVKATSHPVTKASKIEFIIPTKLNFAPLAPEVKSTVKVPTIENLSPVNDLVKFIGPASRPTKAQPTSRPTK